ncbi:MAG: phosphonopyruvate decarboxylase [Deltaproteobacteria bacterium]|nr:phosphonopyruvate decarboxylase [Deltaproteobacteria bacterium]MBW2134579.1 phosphonopyruvate decarboxylase [Deltaproteobacteria bacterium]
MWTVDKLLKLLSDLGWGPYIGVPCSILKPLISHLQADSTLTYIAATSEGEAMGIAAGWTLADYRPVILMQNSGLGNAVNPLTSLQLIYRLPCLLMVSWRGEPGRPDAPQHQLMGQITPSLLSLLGLPSEVLSGDPQADQAKVEHLHREMVSHSSPVALIVTRGTISPGIESKSPGRYPLLRREAIDLLMEVLGGQAAVVATTGKISRELCALSDRTHNFYMVGSMGCASALGLGLALAQPERRVVIVDGDGACLMKLGNVATIGHYRPRNLIHLVLDNESYDSTGGQATVSSTIPLEGVAREAGYATARRVEASQDLREQLQYALAYPGPHFYLVKVASGAATDLERPRLSPVQLKERFMAFVSRPPEAAA